MSDRSHPLNAVLRAIWRASGHNIESLATCITLGGVEFTVDQAHGVFHNPEGSDYHELSLLEFKAALRGLIGWERVTDDVLRNRYDLRFVDALWQAYDLCHQAWMGEEVSWSDFKSKLLHPALDDQAVHWNVRGRNYEAQKQEQSTAVQPFTHLRRVPLAAADLEGN